ncbi:MAG: DUF4293 family protein [Pedobacter sp.]|nr:DUF4293 family protein [Chitinophagaceae bacterium]
MIQRIQSIWLLLAAVFAFLTLKFSFYSGNKIDAATNAKTFLPLNATTSIILLILTVAVAVASLVVIFFYKDRKRQLLVSFGILAISIINIVIYFSQIKKFIEGQFDLTSIITFAIPIFLLLAIRSIWKDEKLVKSTDRLR